MGNFCSCCCGNRDDDIFETAENDKTNLLGSPVEDASRSHGYQSISNKTSSEPTVDQQAKLNQILEKTANNYIDVPALSSPIDQTVYKSKDYASLIESALQKQVISSEKTSLLEDIPNANKSLSEEPLSEEDSKMVSNANSLLVAALQSIKVEDSENLVIPFNTSREKK